MERELVSASPQATLLLGEDLGRVLKGGEVILLSGDLGAGKTLFTKGIARGLGLGVATPVVSPTFTLVNIYKARLDIVHVDLYRLESDEIGELGLEDFMDDSHVMVIEWAEVAHSYFRGRIIEITLTYLNEDVRAISLRTDLPLKDLWVNAPGGEGRQGQHEPGTHEE